MDINTFNQILRDNGWDENKIALFHRNASVYIHEKNKLVSILSGKPSDLCINGTQLGRCYYQYEVIVFNYTGDEKEHPIGMFGRKVTPNRVVDLDTTTYAVFKYQIDSSD